ncbi:MAG: phosphatase PAP2 family protein [Gammaproteobacteria bacterium]|nr:phosphatase PAP2 family protein [Gammaproteobacteria bacterium]
MYRVLTLLAGALVIAPVCGAQDMTSGASPARDWERPTGFLDADDIPNSVALLPPPPAPGSKALALDEELNREALTLRGSARWDLAAQDAIPDPGRAFSCAVGFEISAKKTPKLTALLLRSGTDVGAAVTPAKKHYQRKRPFLVNEQPSCVPRAEEVTALDGSYPSGHAALGWVWALILAELVPDQTDAVLARGWEFGQSRLVCNVHWRSDVMHGRLAGAALLARMHGDEEFRAEIEVVREEIAGSQKSGTPPDRDCDAEARTLATGAPPDAGTR